MDPETEPLTMYGTAADLPVLDWSWVDEQLRSAGSYWISASVAHRHPPTRPVWGVWMNERLELSIGSPRINAAIAAGTALTVNLTSDTDVVIVEGTVIGESADEAAVDEYNRKYEWDYVIDTYGPLTIVEPAKIMAWRSSGWAGRGGFQATGRWVFDRAGDPQPDDRATDVHAIGGVFFRSADPASTRAWYSDHLGLDVDAHGTGFTWRRDGAPAHRGHTQWSPFDHDTEYFGDVDQDFMINYRVDDLDGLLDRLQAAGVEIVGEMERHPFGRFQHVIDGDGRRLELWEPNDSAYGADVDGVTRS